MNNDFRNCIMQENILNNYNSVLLKNKVFEIYALVDYCVMLDDSIVPPHITASYNVIYNQRVSINSSKLEDYVIKKIMLELNKDNTCRNKLLSKINMALKKLSEVELKAFKLSIYDKKNEDIISDEMNHCIENIRKIKKSAYAKFLISLGVDRDCFNN